MESHKSHVPIPKHQSNGFRGSSNEATMVLALRYHRKKKHIKLDLQGLAVETQPDLKKTGHLDKSQEFRKYFIITVP